MFLTKLAIYGTIFSTFFAVSAFSTVQITKQLNKVPVPNETSEDEEDDELYTRELSDTEKFIKEISGFGNLKGNLNLTVSKDNFNLALKGDVFVSMETMDDVQVQASLNIDTLGHTYHVEGAYLNDTIYATIEGNNVKLNTSSLSDITTLFSSVSTPVELPDAFKDIDPDQLLSNLSKMTSEKGENSITYTCKLIDGIPDIIFVTDLNYKLTSLSLTGFDFEGYNINANASIDILGKGHNEIHVDETKYIDLTNDINTMKNGLASQISTLVNNKEIGISSYNIEVLKRKSEIIDEEEVISNELVFNMDGRADISLTNLKDISKCNVNLSGHMSNTNVRKELDSNVDIKLYDGSVYFDYNNQLKLKYAVSDIKDLIEIINTKIKNNSTSDISAVLDKVFPANSDTTSAPLVNIIKNKNYTDILNYYRSTTIDPVTHNLTVNLDASLIGNTGATISLSLATGNKGIESVSVNGIYALGYILNINLELDNYKSFSMTNDEMNTYTNLGYINNVFDEVTNLIHKDQFALTLNGNVNLGKGELAITGNSYVSLSETNDFGVADLNITKGNKTHNIRLDVNRNKVAKDATEEEKADALRTSDVLFSYNNKLNGSLNLKSLTETFDLVKKLASDGNPLLDKIKGLLSRDSTQSTLTKVMNGEVEAILYDNFLNNITYKEDINGYYYDIEINGNLLKSDSTDVVEPIHIYINLNLDYSFTGVGIKGMLNNYSIDIDLGIEEATENNISWKRLTKNSSYYDFSDIKTLAEYLFNTGTKKDFSMSGHVHLYASVLFDFDLGNLDLEAKVHIDEETNETISVVTIKNIPDILLVSDGDWDYREFTMYITDDEVYLHVFYYEEHWLSSTDYYNKWIRLTMSEFTDDIAYYLVNYGLGITTGKVFGNSLDMRNQTSSTDKDVNYEDVLTDYKYKNISGTPTWNLDIDLAELASSSVLGTLKTTITGNDETKLLSSIDAKTTLISVVHADFDATLDSTSYIGDAAVSKINNYISTHSNDKNKQEYKDF